MNRQSQTASFWKTGATGAGLVVLVGLMFAQPLANFSFDLLFPLRGRVPVKDAMIICMDQASSDHLGQPWDSGGDWNRTNHALLLDRLKDCGAKAVVFDIHFARPTTNDDLFIQAIEATRKSGPIVIVGGKIEVSGSGQYQMTNEIPPFAELEKVTSWGLAEFRPQRRHFVGTDPNPSLAWRTAELTVSPPPANRFAERWINFYGPPGWIPKCSYEAALDPKMTSSATFSDKVCFVGGWPKTTPSAGGMRTDEWNTPYSLWTREKSPGVEITATIFLNLRDDNWLRRLPVWSESLILVLAGTVLGFGLGLCRPTVAVGISVVAVFAVVFGASLWMQRQNVWFCWLAVAGVQIPTAMGWSVLAGTKRLAREKAVLEEKLATATRIPPVAIAPVSNSLSETETVVAPEAARVRGDGTPVIPDHTMLRRVGKGAYGEVWLARNAIGTYHAVKVIRREDFGEAGPFEREFRGLQKFMPISHGHPGLVLILHVGRHEQDGFIYYIMEAADDETSGARIDPDSYSPKNLAKEINKHGHLSAAECLRLGLDLTAALEFLHQQNLIHRDIKPANIIYVKGAPKFADIGLVTDIAATGREVTYLGTKGYIAPEGPGTPSADVFSLGKVLYEASMGMGCEMFPELPATFAERVDRAELVQLNKILLKACRQVPGERYQTAAEMHADLLALRT